MLLLHWTHLCFLPSILFLLYLILSFSFHLQVCSQSFGAGTTWPSGYDGLRRSLPCARSPAVLSRWMAKPCCCLPRRTSATDPLPLVPLFLHAFISFFRFEVQSKLGKLETSVKCLTNESLRWIPLDICVLQLEQDSLWKQGLGRKSDLRRKTWDYSFVRQKYWHKIGKMTTNKQSMKMLKCSFAVFGSTDPGLPFKPAVKIIVYEKWCYCIDHYILLRKSPKRTLWEHVLCQGRCPFSHREVEEGCSTSPPGFTKFSLLVFA